MGSERLRAVFPRITLSLDAGVLPLLVFDLDSTIFSTAPRNLQILKEFIERHGAGHAQLQRILDSVQTSDMGWNIHDDLLRLGIEDRGLLASVKSFWYQRFFSDEYVLHDTPVPGAVDFVNACHQRGAMIYYLTGRHVGGMEVGTVQALTRQGFPFWHGRAALHLKPSFDMNDQAFKDEALADIRSYRGRVVATFENEPGNANLFARAFPDALHYLLLTIHSPGAEKPSPELIASEDFVLP